MLTAPAGPLTKAHRRLRRPFAAGPYYDVFRPAQQCLRAALVALLVVLAPPASRAARQPIVHTHREAATSPYTHALVLRARLDALPSTQRTRARYEEVLEAFRTVYHARPSDPHAADAVYAVAQVLRDEGETLRDTKALRDAIAQDEFLRRNYPGSPLCARALYDEASTQRDALHDEPAARAAWAEFLARYPHNALAAEARAQLGRHGSPAPASAADPSHTRTGTHRNAVLDAAIASQGGGAAPPTAAPAAQGALPSSARSGVASAQPSTASSGPTRSVPNVLIERDLPPSTAAAPTVPPAQATAPPPAEDASGQALPAAAISPPVVPVVRTGRLPLVTGVRHWSTSVYTRVAIDLGAEVEYEASRVPSPDRILFDLHGVRIAPELAGKAVTVTDGGYLERIRLAQRAPDVVRVVLDVSEVSEYSAFLLPNPWRLIVDIHRKAGAPDQPAMAAAPAPTGNLAPSSPARTDAHASASTSTTTTGSLVARNRPAPTSASRSAVPTAPPDDMVVSPAPSHRARAGSNPAALAEVATLDRTPGTVRATPAPTSAPVTATVANTQPAAQPGGAAAPDLTTAAPTPGTRSASTRAHGITPADTPAPATHLGSRPATASQARAAAPAAPGAGGAYTLSRTLGLKIGRIVVDAGHGGHDSGTLGPGGIQEKDIVLDVALRLGRLLKQRLGADVIFTRDDDTFIPLETRTAIANKAQADLFISVHANSSSDPQARGVETYFLNFTTSADALEVAARENAVSDQSIHQLSDLVKKITLSDKIAESREFAADVQASLFDGLEDGNPGLKDRGVKKAPFVVLIGANMPSILAEISFLTNPDDARELHDPAYRQRIAESLFRGVSKYIASLSGVRLANGN